MRLTVTALEGTVFALDVPRDTIVSGLKLLISVECGTPEDRFILMKDGQLLTDPDKMIESAGLKDGDLVVLVPSPSEAYVPQVPQNESTVRNPPATGSRIDFSSIRIPRGVGPAVPSGEAETIRQMILRGPPHLLALLRQRSPELALLVNDPVAFSRVYESQRSAQNDQRQELDLTLNADPLDPAVQSRIAEIIRQKNIDRHMENALEHYPETFAQVSMLFVNCKVGRHLIKAFVDSGAQSTIMSEKCAERCNLEPLIDKRWSGMAYGVGTQTIIGRVHNGELEIEGFILPTSFMVLKDQSLDLMIGLDMLKRHQCCIDLKRNVLVLDGGRVETPFLPESEIPLQMRHAELLANDQSPSSIQQMLLDRLNADQRERVSQLTSQGVPLSRAIAELESHGWNVQDALISFMSSEDAP
ncbi:hypothetical protein EG68_01585 [Paragonimus skrjabini miyazakii]|uniref:Ubiquitin-like domain-containing protein n=1 Tax=Paragonimus skrjabini miyazakii TaxID=59628 RepID=A0A8S9Z0X8_9TREM|nr:hypothetical protein EG68_01585 [Paragonimus skrjabini miyazakii]